MPIKMKIKVVANKVQLTGDGIKKTFSDFNYLVKHLNEKKIRIENPEILPPVFQSQLHHQSV
mgnify:CR=1 FL=1